VALIFVRVAFSWIGPNPRNRLFLISYQLTEPILGPVRRLLPQSMGIDLSPMIVTFLIFMLINVLRRGG
jgi:YggT family protein